MFNPGRRNKSTKTGTSRAPAQTEEREKNPKHIDGAMTPAAPGQRGDQQRGENSGVGGGRAFRRISSAAGSDKSAALFRCAVNVRQHYLRQRGQSDRRPFLHCLHCDAPSGNRIARIPVVATGAAPPAKSQAPSQASASPWPSKISGETIRRDVRPTNTRGHKFQNPEALVRQSQCVRWSIPKMLRRLNR